MNKKVMVISLGGSLIVPDKVDFELLKKFRGVLRKNYDKWKFVVVCGGGSIARKYISALKEEKADERKISMAGIRATRMNALFVIQLFGKEANGNLPKDMKDVENYLAKNNVVVCGALRYAEDETSDGTAAKLAGHFKSDFINLTNVKGLFSEDPRKNKNAKFIKKISWKDFEKKARSLKFSAGQHFVLDQQASSVIREHKIKTYIIGKDINQINNILEGRSFIGTAIWE